METKVITTQMLRLLRDFAIVDEYPALADRPSPLASNTEGSLCILDELLRLSGFKFNDPAVTGALRSGERPLFFEIDGSDEDDVDIRPSALLKKLAGDVFDLFALPSLPELPCISLDIGELSLVPSEGRGDMRLVWSERFEGLLLSIVFDTSQVEIYLAILDIDADIDFTDLRAELLLRPRLSAGRLLWDWASWAYASVDDREDEGIRIDASSQELENLVLSRFRPAQPTRVADQPAAAFTDQRAIWELTKALMRMWREVTPNAQPELIGNALMALPLRPFSLPDGFSPKEDLEGLQCIQNLDDITIPDLDRDAELGVGLVLHLLSEELRDVALGLQDPGRVLPWPNTELAETGLCSLLGNLLGEWPASFSPTPLELRQVGRLFGPKLMEHVLDRVEMAHLVDRRHAIETVDVDDEEMRIRTDFPLLPAVRCMRYEVVLEALEILNDGLLGKLDPPSSTPAEVSIRWSCESFHGAYHSLGDAVLLRDENSSPVPFGGSVTDLRRTCSRLFFLEWGDDQRGREGAVKLSGEVFTLHDGERVPLGGFADSIAVTEHIGLPELTAPTEPVRRLADTTTFEIESATPGDFRILVRLVQLPYADIYDWIDISIPRLSLDLETEESIDKPQDNEYQFEARYNGTLFGLTEWMSFDDETVGRGPVTIEPEAWLTRAVYHRDHAAVSFRVDIVAWARPKAVDQETPENVDEPAEIEIASWTVHRFADTEGNAIDFERRHWTDDTWTAVTENDAVFEWGIRPGNRFRERRVSSDSARLSAIVRLRNQRFDVRPVPVQESTKRVRIRFKSLWEVVGTEAGNEEFQVRPSVKVFEQEELVDEDKLGTYGPFEMSHFRRSIQPKAITRRQVHPEAVIEATCKGREIDPVWDDSLGTATREVTVTEDDGMDLDEWVLSTRRDGQFKVKLQVHGVSSPPVPQLWFDGAPPGVDELAGGAALQLNVRFGWAPQATLVTRTGDDLDDAVETREVVDADTRQFMVNPTQTTWYQVRSENSWSRENTDDGYIASDWLKISFEEESDD